MTKPLIITAGVQRRLAELPPNEKRQCAVALLELCETFGRPHVHSGLGVREFLPGVFECRGTISLRLVFRDAPDAATVNGTQLLEQVRRRLKLLDLVLHVHSQGLPVNIAQRGF